MMLEHFRKVPHGVVPLYFMQIFSTFSFAIIYSSLSLYLTNQLGFSQVSSNNLVGIFLALNFVLHLFGGAIGGTLLSNRFLFLLSIFFQLIGLACLTIFGGQLLHVGLGLFLVGCGLNTTCLNSLLAQRFCVNNSYQESAFFMSYAAMNIGFTIGYIFSGLFDHSNQYENLFLIGCIVSTITIIIALFSWENLKDVSTKLAEFENRKDYLKNKCLGILASIVLIPIMIILFNYSELANILVVTISACMFMIILYLSFNQKNIKDMKNLKVFLVLTISSVIFWMIYYTGPMGVTLFIKNNGLFPNLCW